MSKSRRKSIECFNCNNKLKVAHNYCPTCGQENHNKQASIGTLANDFASDYVGFDNKLFRSIFPLLTNPGAITKEYLKGKRVRFIKPIRMFLFLSFLYYGLSMLLFEDTGSNVTFTEGTVSEKDSLAFNDSFRQNIKLAVFFFTPIMAWFFMLFYKSETRKYYVSFFVYTLHLFSLLFLLGIISELVDALTNFIVPESLSANYFLLGVKIILFIYMIYYSVVSLKRVFQKKNNILLFIIVLLMAVIASAIIILAFLFLLWWRLGAFDV
ncbi:MAG: DUF3667 domain-containing protein [Crocinitomicaceae bacterium]|nr:DUF3667 domain-containing protein [Crocinitomicaceae bacterium]